MPPKAKKIKQVYSPLRDPEKFNNNEEFLATLMQKELKLAESRTRSKEKQDKLMALSKGIINFNKLIKRNQKAELKTQKAVKLSTRHGMARDGRVLMSNDRIRFPLVVLSINQNPNKVSILVVTPAIGTRRRNSQEEA